MLTKVLTAKKKHYSRKRFNDFLRLFKSLSLRQKHRPFWAVFFISFACFYPIFLITGSISYYFNNIY